MGVRLGCSGWGYDDWRGSFYAAGARPEEYLQAYARVFSCAEIDSTFYQAPTLERVASWRDRTPEGFLFFPKTPKTVTHDAKLGPGALAAFESFVERLQPLRVRGKLGPIVLQLPPSFRFAKDEERLRAFLDAAPTHVQVAVELRDASWWRPETYALLARTGRALVWSTNETGRTPTQHIEGVDTTYVRFVGDRALDDEGGKWTHVQRAQDDEIEALRHAILDDIERSERSVFLIANNHFMGHAPLSLVEIARKLGLPPIDLSLARRAKGQPSLGDFG